MSWHDVVPNFQQKGPLNSITRPNCGRSETKLRKLRRSETKLRMQGYFCLRKEYFGAAKYLGTHVYKERRVPSSLAPYLRTQLSLCTQSDHYSNLSLHFALLVLPAPQLGQLPLPFRS